MPPRRYCASARGAPLIMREALSGASSLFTEVRKIMRSRRRIPTLFLQRLPGRCARGNDMIRLTCFFAAIAVFRQAAGFETAGAHGQGGAGLSSMAPALSRSQSCASALPDCEGPAHCDGSPLSLARR